MSKTYWGILGADFHSGARTSLRKPRVRVADSGELVHLPMTQKMCAGYMAFARAYHKPDFFGLDGDMADGENPKDLAATWTGDVGLQVDSVVPFVDAFEAKRVLLVEGTGYHGRAMKGTLDADHAVAEKVARAAPDENGCICPPERYFAVGDAIIHMSHYIAGTSVFQYRGTAPSRELAMNRIMDAENDVYKADLIVRAHVHHFYRVQAGEHSNVVVLPCWKAKDGHSARRAPFSWVPHVGLVLVEICGREVNIKPLLLALPEQRPPLQSLEQADAAIRKYATRAKDEAETLAAVQAIADSA